jgi:hypothetical protein
MKTNMHKHSLEAYKDVLMTSNNVNQKKIFDYLLKDKNNLGATRQRLSQDLHLPINVICGRCNGLIKLQIIEDSERFEIVDGHRRSILVINFDVCNSIIDGLEAFKNKDNDK